MNPGARINSRIKSASSYRLHSSGIHGGLLAIAFAGNHAFYECEVNDSTISELCFGAPIARGAHG